MSKETNWTPGPWWIEGETGDVVAKDGDWEICTFSRCDSQLDHDAHLIAEAPELYAALSELLKLHDNEVFTKSAWDAAMESARVALAKARGES